MKVNLTCVMLVMDEVGNQDIRKNSIKKISLLVKRTSHNLPTVVANTDEDIKDQIRNELIGALGTNRFHLEQVYTLGDKKYFDSNAIDIIHLGCKKDCARIRFNRCQYSKQHNKNWG